MNFCICSHGFSAPWAGKALNSTAEKMQDTFPNLLRVLINTPWCWGTQSHVQPGPDYTQVLAAFRLRNNLHLSQYDWRLCCCMGQQSSHPSSSQHTSSQSAAAARSKDRTLLSLCLPQSRWLHSSSAQGQLAQLGPDHRSMISPLWLLSSQHLTFPFYKASHHFKAQQALLPMGSEIHFHW